MLPGGEAALLVGNGQLSASGKADLNALEADLRSIPGIRQSVDAGAMTPTAAFQAYSAITDAEFQYFYAETLDRGTSMQAIGIGTIDAVLAMDMITREATLVDGALTVDHGRMDAAARQLFISSATNRQFLMNQALSLLTPSLRAGYATVVNSPAYHQFQALESQIMASTGNGPIMVNPTDVGHGLGRRSRRHAERRGQRRRTAVDDQQLGEQRAVHQGHHRGRRRAARRRRVRLPARLVRPQGHRRPDQAVHQRPRDGRGTAAARRRAAAARR